MKVVINKCYGGFGLSKEAYHWLGLKWDGFGYLIESTSDDSTEENPFQFEDFEGGNTREEIYAALQIPFVNNENWWGLPHKVRTSLRLVKCVEELGNKASGNLSKLEIVSIPDNIEFEIEDYDGSESIHEVHRSWS